MILFLIRKTLWAAATLAVASVLVFAALEIVPRDPAEVMLGINATDDAVAALREDLGLNKPVLERYFSWVLGMLQGDFGKSYTYSVPVKELIADRITISLPLALIALAISATQNPTAKVVIEKLGELRGCEMHVTHMPTPGDEAGLRRLGLNLTSEPNFASRELFVT